MIHKKNLCGYINVVTKENKVGLGRDLKRLPPAFFTDRAKYALLFYTLALAMPLFASISLRVMVFLITRRLKRFIAFMQSPLITGLQLKAPDCF